MTINNKDAVIIVDYISIALSQPFDDGIVCTADLYGGSAWYLDGKLHRTDGPAVCCRDGSRRWYFHGQYIDCKSQEEFERLLKLKAFW